MRKTPFLEPFVYPNDQLTKTGSGQTSEQVEEKTFFAGRSGEGPFLRTGVETLKDMGITAIRLGGSFSTNSYYFWKDWHGRPWERASLGAKWGSDLISGFGPFEFLDMCEEAGIEPIMTTAAQQPPPSTSQIFGGGIFPSCCTAEDMGDLIEYVGGNSSTEWGRQRAADGHPGECDNLLGSLVTRTTS